MIDPRSLLIGVAAGAAAVLVLQAFLFLVRPWFKAFFSGCPVPLLTILGMRLRGNPAGLLIEAYIVLVKSGVAARLDVVEVVYIANKSKARTLDALVALVKEELGKGGEGAVGDPSAAE
jgi:uncharacterized protein YqfA (UPF0365 family)